MKKCMLSLLITLSLNTIAADDLDDALSGFDQPPLENTGISDLDDALQGFELQDEPTIIKTNFDENKLINFSGKFGFSSSYNYEHSKPSTDYTDYTDYRGLSKLRLSVDLITDISITHNWKAKVELKAFYDPIYSINSNRNYNADTLNTYETQAIINDAYIIGSLSDSLDIKIGRQIVVWGKSDSLRVTDIINPLDNREPGLVDIEDLRLPILISKLSYYYEDWSYNLFAIHEQRNPLEAAIDSQFFPTSVFPFLPTFVLPDVGEGNIDLSKTTLSASIDGRFSGWDLSFYGGRVTDSRWHFEDNKTTRRYGLIDITGIATNFIINGFLIKAEIAYLNNLSYNTTSKEKARIDSLLGIEYMGITNLVLSVEYANRSIQDYESQMINSPDMIVKNTSQFAIRTSYSFDHDNATINLLGYGIGDSGEQGGFYRLWLNYDINDEMQTSMGIIDYQSGTNLMWKALSNNDRLFFNLKYSF